ncbi:right-handed parallel beta-helix repeat-containing protein [Photobacterium sp. TLY01]|uniref:chondroitinase-B domain-containing protein n=1 Tax=Photobacterium sp. TLY01 TaxID=2907534 RepID=UPI001F3AC8E1|nr:right-handed parallel beta-helix repeat-containing protein [Photobacterium sp. TLY01]UIP30120.1 right-handed parallel beta-helix repeat-containing protein [Photobacterium sp. TLY01]
MISKGIKTYFATIGVLAHVVILVAGVFLVKHWSAQNQTLPAALRQSASHIEQAFPKLAPVNQAVASVAGNLASPSYFWREFDTRYWPSVGPEWSSAGPQSETSQPAPLGTLWVSDEQSFEKALEEVLPGQDIVVKKGTYFFSSKRLNISQVTPSASRPVALRAEEPGTVLLQLDGLEGIVINQPYWTVSGLTFQGVCPTPSDCDHALHIVGDADHNLIQNNVFIDFNAAIKVNRMADKFPDHGTIQRNHFYNTQPRDTSRSVTPINLDHGNAWTINRNIIRDFIKSGGNQVSYGAFMKGGNEHGIIENNLVICNSTSRKYEGYQIGLSLGGGGMEQENRRGQTDLEGVNHTVRNNIVLHCNDVGLYINKSANSLINNNILYHTSGIDVRFPQSSAELVNNIVSGKIRERDQGKASASHNLILSPDYLTEKQQMDDWFTSPAIGNFSPKDDEIKAKLTRSATGYPVATQEKNLSDFCGNPISAQDTFAGAFKDSQHCFRTRPDASGLVASKHESLSSLNK